VPELASVPDRFLQEPWAWDAAAKIIGRSYPERIIDLKASTAAAKDRVYGARRSPAFRNAAGGIQDNHGSRKSGMPVAGPRRGSGTGRKPSAAKGQMEFDL
jgi:deoxyribodipyrimidine photo-lyase